MAEIKFYSVRFEPRPLIGVRFANPDIVAEYDKEISARLRRLYYSLEGRVEKTVHSTMQNNQFEWLHTEGGLFIPKKGQLYLPPILYGIAVYRYFSMVTTPNSEGLDHELDFIVACNDDWLREEAKSLMESDLPSAMVVRKSQLFDVQEIENGISIQIKPSGMKVEKAIYN